MFNMNGHLVSDVQLEPKARGYDTTQSRILKSTCIENGCKRSYSSIGMILGEKIERKDYLNQQNFVSVIQLLIKYSFLLSFMNY